MRLFLTVLVLTATIILAGDHADKKAAPGKSMVRQVDLAPFVLPSFYIGYNKLQSNKSVLTLQINEASVEQDQIHFQFTMNSNLNRINGYGTLDPVYGWITLSNHFTGRFVKDVNGMLILESLPSDTLSNWYLKEKQ